MAAAGEEEEAAGAAEPAAAAVVDLVKAERGWDWGKDRNRAEYHPYTRQEPPASRFLHWMCGPGQKNPPEQSLANSKWDTDNCFDSEASRLHREIHRQRKKSVLEF